MIVSGKFKDKTILVVDSSSKKNNDRTWCFWEKEPGFFEELVYKKYNKLWFHSKSYSALNDIVPYTYKLLRGIDFYDHCISLIRSSPNITWQQNQVSGVHSIDGRTWIDIGGEEIEAAYIFNSIIFEKPVLKSGQYYMLQHFKGWIIETGQEHFHEDQATLMDFRVPQHWGTCFVYEMPFNSTRALVEYTIFSNEVLEDEIYIHQLKNYIEKILGVHDYKVLEVEDGLIPMTNFSYPLFEGNIVNIGTAGGQTKASTGYTFQFIQKQSVKIIDALDKTGKPFYEESVFDKRFALYDSTLLNILCHNKLEGADIFTRLFQMNRMTDILKFLDNETSLAEELKVITVLPKKHFIQAALQELL